MGDEKELRRSSTQKNIEIKTDLKLDHVDAGRKSLPVPEPAQKKKQV